MVFGVGDHHGHDQLMSTFSADGVLFEPQAQGAANTERYMRDPLEWPQKRLGQKWINFGYETPIYFPLWSEPLYLVSEIPASTT